MHTLPNSDVYEVATFHAPADTGLAWALVDLFRGLSVIDIGAGQGQYTRFFEAVEPSINFMAFDGAYNVESFTENRVTWTDLTLPLDVPPADWVLNIEVS